MPALIPYIPLIAAGVGAAASVSNGMRNERMNREYLGRADQAAAAQQELIANLMSGITPDVYRAQAQQAGNAAIDQLSSAYAQRGMLSSGAMHTAGAKTLSELYTNANAVYRQERMNAIGMALGGQQQLNNQWGQRINPDPYSGLSTALSGLGQAGAQYLQQNRTATSTGTPMPGFGVTYTPNAPLTQTGAFGVSFGAPYQFTATPTATPIPFGTQWSGNLNPLPVTFGTRYR